MKKIKSFFCFLLFVSVAFAQSPQGINYQAVARNSSGAILSNQNIGVRITICLVASGALPVYKETHSVVTNQFGLFTLNIGNGTPTLGTFAAIHWSNSTPYLKVEMDATGGTNYVLMGISQLLSVPYAFYSLNTGDSTKWSTNGNAGTDSTNFIGTTDAHDLRFKVNNIPAGYLSGGATATNNTSFGLNAGNNNSGTYNIAIGTNALDSNTTGYNNIAIGGGALNSNNSGAANVAIGINALLNNTYGVSNVAIGVDALHSHTFSQNISNTSNVAVGEEALYNDIDGFGNTALGRFALSGFSFGFGNTAVGNYADVSAASLSNATAIGLSAISDANNKVRIGNVNVTVVESQVGSWTSSDGRFKTNISDEVKGLQFIKKLHPVIYNFDTRKFDEFLMQNMPDSVKQARMKETNYSMSTKIRHSGFIAQEVEQAAKECGYDFAGVHHPESTDDNWSLSYENFVVPLVKAVQEQQKEIEEQRELIKKQGEMIEGMKIEIKKIKNKIK